MTGEAAWRREVNDVLRHDLRTRVAVGQGYLAMLREHYDAMTPEQRAAAFDAAGDALARLHTFAARLLMDDKLATRETVPQAAEVALAGLVDSVLAAYPAVVRDVAPDVPETVRVDPVMVREILDNLLSNAVTAAPPGTDVTLRVRAGGHGLRFAVHDAGDTVTEADREVLFRRYGRTAHSRAARTSGTGLGLSIVRRLVEAHGGSYGVELGGGATFWVELPVPSPGPPSP